MRRRADYILKLHRKSSKHRLSTFQKFQSFKRYLCFYVSFLKVHFIETLVHFKYKMCVCDSPVECWCAPICWRAASTCPTSTGWCNTTRRVRRECSCTAADARRAAARAGSRCSSCGPPSSRTSTSCASTSTCRLSRSCPPTRCPPRRSSAPSPNCAPSLAKTGNLHLSRLEAPISSHSLRCILYGRLLYMKFVRAFVSFIRFYSRHDCKLIFRWEGVPVAFAFE